MKRRAFLGAAVLIAALPALPQSQTAARISDAQLDALEAFAHTYGIVRYFHPSDSLDRVDWNRFLVYGAARMGAVKDRAAIGPELEALFTPPVAAFKVVPKGTPAEPVAGEGPNIEWRHLGYGIDPMPRDLPFVSWRTHHKPLQDGEIKAGYFQHEGVAALVTEPEPILRIAVPGDREALVPVSMPMSATKIGEAQDLQLKTLGEKLAAVELQTQTYSREQSWADGIAAWNVARHFYPYWSVVHVDWNGVLRKWLAEQPARQSREQLRDQLRRLMAPLRDGHERIIDTQDKRALQMLPIGVRPLGDKWVVEASLVPERAKAGDVIESVNGIPAKSYFDALMALQSGSPQFVRWRAAREFAQGPAGAILNLVLDRVGRRVKTSLKFEIAKPVFAARPDAIAEIKPGIFYVDLSRFDPAAFGTFRDRLAAANGIVFDMRGYPAAQAQQIVNYWLAGRDAAQWMIVPRFDRPYGEYDTGWSFGWKREANAALAKPKKVLMIDGRALSYSESLIGYFAGQKTGPIVGEPSGGANGNVDVAKLPSGLNYLFTGMKVTRHDGSMFHGEGFAPDVAVAPTILGLAGGRDEVLERAIAEASAP